MKKKLALVLALSLALTLTACGSGDGTQGAPDQTQGTEPESSQAADAVPSAQGNENKLIPEGSTPTPEIKDPVPDELAEQYQQINVKFGFAENFDGEYNIQEDECDYLYAVTVSK